MLRALVIFLLIIGFVAEARFHGVNPYQRLLNDLKAEPAQGQAFKRTGIIKNCESNIAGGECRTNLDCENRHNSKICGDARCSALNHVCCTQKHNLC